MRRAVTMASLVCAVAAGPAAAATPPSAKQASHPRAVTVLPFPGTQTASPTTEISFRGLPQHLLGRVRVVGSVSGRHAGTFVAHADGAGASFVPVEPFAPGERVTVITHLRVRDARTGTFEFSVARPANVSLTPPPSVPLPPLSIETFATEPDLHVARVNVTAGSTGAAAGGLVFLAPRRGAGDDGVEILDATGEPVWFHRLPAGVQAADFREQSYRGHPVLTWWQGQLGAGYGAGEGEILDTAYGQVATVHAGNGYPEDLHELELTSAGTALVTAYDPVQWDLSSIGGPAAGVVLDCVVQEVEIGTGRVLFEWHSLGNVPIADSYAPLPPDSTLPYDYFHVNSVTTDDAGDLLVSARATHTVYEIDGLTGRIHWRLGGKHSDFAFGDGAAFHSQHDAKWVDHSTLSLFDNGAGVGPNNEKVTRAIVLHVDRAARSATLVAAFAEPHGLLFASQGDVEPLPNGDWFVGWGEGPFATEFSPTGAIALNLRLTSGSSYRAYRFDWHGLPSAPPDVVARRDGNETDVSVAWNGATDVAAWQVLAGSSPVALAPVASAPRSGFETTIAAPTTAAYVAARALDAAGRVLGTSPAVAVEP